MLSEGVPVCQFMLTCIGLGWTMDFRQGEEIVRQLKDPSSHLCTAKIFGGRTWDLSGRCAQESKRHATIHLSSF